MAAFSIKEPKIITATHGASVTDVTVADFTVDKYAALHFRADITCSSVTAATGITLKLQHRTGAGAYADVGGTGSTVAVTADGVVSLLMNIETAANQAVMPLKQACRLVVTTGAGDAVTVDEVAVYLG